MAYAIAKFAYDMRERGNVLNFETVWKAQVVPVALRDALIVSSAAVHSVIVQPPVSGQNVTEWAKQQACWKRVMAMEVVWPAGIDEILVSKSDADSGSRTSRSDRKMISGIEAQSAALRAGTEFWSNVYEWARANHRLSPNDVRILELISTPGKLAQEKQAIRALELLRELNAAGFTLDLPV